jgi:hypothetical protein
MNRGLGIGLLAVGVILLILGFNESHSFSSDVSRVFNNTPSDRSIWFLVGGGLAAAIGLYFTLARAR